MLKLSLKSILLPLMFTATIVSALDNKKTETFTLTKNTKVEVVFTKECYAGMTETVNTYIPANTKVSGNLSTFFSKAGLKYVAPHINTTLTSSNVDIMQVQVDLTGKGNLPKNFSINISGCSLLGDGHWDNESQRFQVEIYKMYCNGRSDVEAVVYGLDGIKGVKGEADK